MRRVSATPSILFMCLGNICRSPTAEAVLAHLAAERGARVTVDGAGIGAWHVGEPPDRRSAAEAYGAAGFSAAG